MDRLTELAQGARHVQIKMQRGDVEVRAAEGASWTLDWSSDQESDTEPRVEREGDTLIVRQRDGLHGIGRLSLRLSMPLGVESLELRTGMGNVSAEGLHGSLRASTGHGAVTLHAGRGNVEASSGNGTVTIEDYEGRITLSSGNGRISAQRINGETTLSTGNGRVEVTRAGGRLKAATGNGDAVLTSVAGEAELSSGHGQIAVTEARGLALRATTALGSVRVERGSVQALRLNSMMGEVYCSAELLPGIQELSTAMGNVTLELAPTARARIDAQTSFGQVNSDFPLVRVGRTGPMGFGGVRMVGSVGEGEPQADVALRSGKGTLTIRRGAGSATPRGQRADDEPARAEAVSTEPEQSRPSAPHYDSTLAILEALARGEISPAEADDLLSSRT